MRTDPLAVEIPGFDQVGDDLLRRALGDLHTAAISRILAPGSLEHELRDAERSLPQRVVLDLAAIVFLDSTGIHLLFEAQERAETSGRQFVLRHVPGHAHRLFTLTGLISRLTVE